MTAGHALTAWPTGCSGSLWQRMGMLPHGFHLLVAIPAPWIGLCAIQIMASYGAKSRKIMRAGREEAKLL